jgi:hypothetical protein
MQAQITQSVRQIVVQTLTDLGLSGSDDLEETILVRDGVYCGRRFDAHDGHAIWFVEEEQLKFFRADGSVARVIEPIMRQARALRSAA